MLAAKSSLYNLDFTKKENSVRLPWIYKEAKLGFAKAKAKSWFYAVDPIENKMAWWIGVPTNYQIAYLPFNHNYHHILPFEALTKLTYDELDILQESEYNLNGKLNMIILPCLDAYGIAMKLPAHPYNHPVYTSAIKTIVNEIRVDVSKKKKKHEVTDQNVQNFKTKLENWQKREFDVIVNYGKSLAKTEDPENPSDPNQINGCPIASASP
jgi:hypothetical protein